MQNASDVQYVSDDNNVSWSDGEGSCDRVFSTEEFSDPFDLGGIEEGVRQQMLDARQCLWGVMLCTVVKFLMGL